MSELEIYQTAEALVKVDYDCRKIKHLDCDKCHFSKLRCYGTGSKDRLVDRIIEQVQMVLRNKPKHLNTDVPSKIKSNKYQLLRRK